MDIKDTGHLILESSKLELLIKFLPLDSGKMDYLIVSNKMISIEEQVESDNLKSNVFMASEKVISDFLTQDNLKKYFLITQKGLLVNEKIFLPTLTRYLDVKITPQKENISKINIEFQEKLPSFAEFQFSVIDKKNQQLGKFDDLMLKKDVLSKKIDVSKLKLEDLIDFSEINKLMGIFNKLYNIPVVIVDFEGNFLTSVGMSEICSNFHRKNPISRNKCVYSDVKLTENLKQNEIRFYKCLNNMYDLVSPIFVGNKHIANFFIGQFFLDNEEVNYDLFKKQAEDLGFNTKEYLAALDKIPRIKKDKIMLIISFYKDLLSIITTLAHSRLNLLGMNKDIEQREEKLKQITDNMTDVVFTADFDFNITYVSPSIERLTSFTVQEYLNLSIEDRYTPRAVKEIKEAIREELIKDENCANKNRSNINTLALYDKNKNIIIVSIHSKFLRDKSGKPFAIIANLRDITKEYKIEKKLEHQLELLSLLTSIAVDYINIPTENIEKSINITLAKIAKFVHADRAYIFTYDWNKKISTNTYEWVAEGISSEKDNLQAVPLEAMEYWPEMHKQGQTIIINDLKELSDYPNVQKMLGEQDIKSLITIPLMMGDQCVGFTGFDSVKSKYEYSSSERSILAIFAELLVNIHNRIELENALRAEREKALSSDQLKSNLLKNISHEFRTPLNGIVGFSELLQQKSPDYETGNMANMIYSSAVRLNHVLDSIMLLTQLEDINNKTIVNLKTINVSKVISDVYLLFEEQFKSKNLTCSFEIEPNIYGDLDEKLFKQALIHLLNNALKFTHQGGVRLLCSSQADKIIIEIEDTGIGIPEESLKIIFSEFRQASEGYNRAYEGVGLGLTISKRIMDLMSGEISIKSRILEGSTFTITLPLSTYNKSLVREFEQIQEDISFNDKFDKLKVLIVEDNLINQKLVISILKNKFSTDLAISGEVAVILAKKKKYDIILMDIHLGEGIDGLTATKIIKKDTINSNTPVIAVTGYTMYGDKKRILAEGCDYYLGKPYKKIELLNVINQVLSVDSKSAL